MTENSTSKTNLVIVVIGIIFMFSLLFYAFGSTHDGIYSIARVKTIEPIENEDPESTEKAFAVEIEMLDGPYSGKTLAAEHFETPGSAYNLSLTPGETVLAVTEQQDDQLVVGIDEHYKSRRLMLLAMVIILVIAAIGGVNGVKSMLAMFFTLIVVFGFMARMLMKGVPPLPLTVGCSLVIVIVNVLIIAGRTNKGFISAVGTLFGVILSGFFGWLSIFLLKLTGFSGDESTFLQLLDSTIDLRGIMLSGIIIGALGAVMDVAISIASALFEISLANPAYDRAQLFKSGMNIGRDVIGSMVNTLILAYTGASLTLILVFAMQKEDFPLIKIMNMEFICTEVVRSLAGLFGMVLAIPITALLSSVVYTRWRVDATEPDGVEVE